MSSETRPTRRKYHRRSPDERIAELERRISELKLKQQVREKKDDPVLREIPKVQRRLRKFAQLAMNNQRPDIANSITAFTAGLERILHAELGRNRAAEAEADDEAPDDD